MEIDRAGLQVLTRAECMDLLRSTTVGRIGVSWRAMPMILPVRFNVAEGRILVATWDGSILSKATRGTVVAFEAEGPVGSAEPSWSVLVNGIADHREMDHRSAPADRWAGEQPTRLLSITTDHVTGRSYLPAGGTFDSGPRPVDRSTIEA